MKPMIFLAALVGSAAVAGDRAPDFKLVDRDGVTRSLTDLRGRAVVLDFFATWDKFCGEETRTLARWHREMGPRGLTVVAVSVDRDGWKAISAWSENRDVPYAVVWDDRLEAMRRYGVSVLPAHVVVDPDGRIAYRDFGLDHGKALESAVRAAVGRVAPKAVQKAGG